MDNLYGKKKLVNIIIPMYKTQLSYFEKKSFKQVISILSKYDITIIKPESLNLNHYQEDFPNLKFVSFDDNFFLSIQTYNQLMLSSKFYERFLDYEFILIYQLDAYVFSDELVAWCNKGYDYIGAPWLQNPIYKKPLLKEYERFVYWLKKIRNKSTKQLFLFGKIGNGGFSLRKVMSHYKASITYKEKIEFYLSHNNSRFYNEDVFWATEVPEFSYPNPQEAIQFSFEKYPKYCYKLNKGKLPFGCHAWHKRKMKKFWKPIIDF